MKNFMDMDIGDEIDDALALYFAMTQGYEIVGVTTVFRNTLQRARMAKKLLKTYGGGYESVPVFAGFGSAPNGPHQDWPDIPHWTQDLLSPAYAPEGEDPEQAVDFLLSCCRQYGKDLILIAIGPFTNIARALEKDPLAIQNIGQVVIMGGAYFRQYADWNVMCDASGAAQMFRGLRNLHCLGADVTHQLDVSEADTARLLAFPGQSAAREYLGQLLNLWKEKQPYPYPLVLHDPLAVYYVSHPEVCEMTPVRVAVLTEGFGKGLTLNVDAYRKAAMNPAYTDFDFDHRVLAAQSVRRSLLMEAFLESLL